MQVARQRGPLRQCAVSAAKGESYQLRAKGLAARREAHTARGAAPGRCSVTESYGGKSRGDGARRRRPPLPTAPPAVPCAGWRSGTWHDSGRGGGRGARGRAVRVAGRSRVKTRTGGCAARHRPRRRTCLANPPSCLHPATAAFCFRGLTKIFRVPTRKDFVELALNSFLLVNNFVLREGILK